MAKTQSAIVYFGVDLPPDQFCDMPTRLRVLDQGIRAIKENIEGVLMHNRFNASCAVMVMGTAEAVESLRRYVEQSALGEIAIGAHDRVAVIAADSVPATLDRGPR